FATLGYVVWQDGSLEPVYEKVALFADDLDHPTHVARQLPSGRWTSKLGRAEDIEHDLHELEGALYGGVVLRTQRRPDAVHGGCPSGAAKSKQRSSTGRRRHRERCRSHRATCS